MNFSQALHELKHGKKITRLAWSNDEWLYLVPENKYPAQTFAAKNYWRGKSETVKLESGEVVPLVPYGAYIAIKTCQQNVIPWTPSQADIMANDWQWKD